MRPLLLCAALQALLAAALILLARWGMRVDVSTTSFPAPAGLHPDDPRNGWIEAEIAHRRRTLRRGARACLVAGWPLLAMAMVTMGVEWFR